MLFWFFTLSAFMLAGAYALLFQKTVAHLVTQKTASAESAAISARLGALEARYNELQATITRDRAETLGLIAPETVLFATQGSAKALSLRGNDL